MRLDSGDLAALSQEVRKLLPDVAIFASGDLDEYEIARLQGEGASIDGYGIGTKLVTGTPVNGVYKLVEIDGIPVMKESSSKVTYPGRKQIFRQYEGDRAVKDILALASEAQNHGAQPLLQPVMQNGKLTAELPSLPAIAQRTAESVASLSAAVRQVTDPSPYNVEITPELEALTQQVRKKTVSSRS